MCEPETALKSSLLTKNKNKGQTFALVKLTVRSLAELGEKERGQSSVLKK